MPVWSSGSNAFVFEFSPSFNTYKFGVLLNLRRFLKFNTARSSPLPTLIWWHCHSNFRGSGSILTVAVPPHRRYCILSSSPPRFSQEAKGLLKDVHLLPRNFGGNIIKNPEEQTGTSPSPFDIVVNLFISTSSSSYYLRIFASFAHQLLNYDFSLEASL